MGFFNFFKRRCKENTPDNNGFFDAERVPHDESHSITIDEQGIALYEERVDYLGLAAMAKRKAQDAMGRGDYNAAWTFTIERKDNYLMHASYNKWGADDVLSIDGTASEDFARILYKEGKHKQALVHIVYWTSTARNVIKDHDKKLGVYFRRCKFENITFDEFKAFAEKCRKHPDYVQIQNRIAEMS